VENSIERRNRVFSILFGIKLSADRSGDDPGCNGGLPEADRTCQRRAGRPKRSALQWQHKENRGIRNSDSIQESIRDEGFDSG
jgi:hypothetical protein